MVRLAPEEPHRRIVGALVVVLIAILLVIGWFW